jgi:hypothetical protein
VAAKKMKNAMTGQEKDKVRPGNVARTTARHDRNRENQELRRQANVVRRAMGVHTPWEAAKYSRRFERLARKWTVDGTVAPGDWTTAA